MSIKIFHTADVHIGMKYKGYGSKAKELARGRLESLETMVEEANLEGCELFIIAGDLFDRVSLKKWLVKESLEKLRDFTGKALLILPGNHDYLNENSGLWYWVRENLPENGLLLDEEEPVSLEEYGLDKVVVYPAPCPEKHGRENRLGWIKQLKGKIAEEKINIGIVHGTLEGEAPKKDRYYYMKKDELLQIREMDIWLMGHIHQCYSDREETSGVRIFMPGTPEPDGMDCTHTGAARIIEVEKGNVYSRPVETGRYRFRDVEHRVGSKEELEGLLEKFTGSKNTVLRLHLEGTLPEEVYREYTGGETNEIYERLKDEVFYLQLENELKPQITEELIKKEFSQDSIPYRLLGRLLAEDDRTLQVAYDLIKEVQE